VRDRHRSAAISAAGDPRDRMTSVRAREQGLKSRAAEDLAEKGDRPACPP
jgi:hypothetical protein